MFSAHKAVFAGLIGLGIATLPGLAAAENYSESAVSLGYSWNDKPDWVTGTGSTSKERATLRLEHYGSNVIGDNYFSLDIYNSDARLGSPDNGSGSKNENFFTWNAHYSGSKITGSKLEFGPISDVALMSRVISSSYDKYRQGALGLSLYWKVPGLSTLETSVLRFRDDGDTPDTYGWGTLWRTYYYAPFQAFGLNWMTDGYLHFKQDKAKNRLYFEPQIYASFGPKDALALGLRLEFDKVTGKATLDGQHDSRFTTSVVGKWTF
ncbi:hypothetical protein [Derxia lacustris]|uniref:hypothetical protein n=1 Tax=Derxia lacustris TaxID=764842 RepID=UPI000A16CD54|nr:hypothetical protein [Derxia lacustris]